MSDGIQLQNIRGTTTDLPPPAYVNPAYGKVLSESTCHIIASELVHAEHAIQ